MKKSVRDYIMDSFVNTLTGLGIAGKDKRLGGALQYAGAMTENETESCYASDALAARVVDLLPDEATREWIDFKPDEPKIKDEIDRLGIKRKVTEAWKIARRAGGAGIFLNVGDPKEKLNEPLDMTKIKKLISLPILTRFELLVNSTDIEGDISNPNFDEPNMYSLQQRGISKNVGMIHHSRIVRFDGKKLPQLLRIANQYWGDSIYTALWEALRDFGVAHGGVANVVQDFRLLAYKVKGLVESIAAGEEALIKKRLENMSMSRSVLGAFMLDEDESMESIQTNITGLEKLLDAIKYRLQSATDIPHTKLFNESPSGLSATGKAEETGWYDYVASQQEDYLAPKLDRIFEVMFTATAGVTGGKQPKDWSYEFHPLWQLSAGDQAAVDKINMETDQGYADMGVLGTEEIREKRFPDLEPDKLPEPPALPEPAEPAEPDITFPTDSIPAPRKMQEGQINKGGHNDPPTTPRPAPPKGQGKR